MFASLRCVLEDLCNSSKTGLFYFISEPPDTSANFLVNYYLLEAINDHNICFIALQNTWSHYCVIGNKFGFNLRSKASDGSISLLDSNKEIFKTLFDKPNNDNVYSNVYNNRDCLKKIYFFIKSCMGNKNNKKNILIIDSLMPLINMNFTAEDIDTFIQYCFQIVKADGFLVISSTVDKNDKASILLSNLLLRRCSYNLEVKGLSTGVSNNVHGKLTIKLFPKVTSEDKLKEKSYHYKVEDRDVKLFEIGSTFGSL